MIEKKKNDKMYEIYQNKEIDRIKRSRYLEEKFKEESDDINNTLRRISERLIECTLSYYLGNNSSTIKKKAMSNKASMLLSRVGEIYAKALKERDVESERTEKYIEKYYKITNKMKRKAKEQKEKNKQRQYERFLRIKKIELLQRALKDDEQERISKIENELELKDMNARRSRAEFIEELRKKYAESNKPKNVEKIEIRKTLRKRITEEFNLEESKLYQEYLKTIKLRDSLMFRISKKDYSNPYIVAEMRLIQRTASNSISKPNKAL